MVFCTHCGQSFTRDEHLERHIVTRTSIFDNITNNHQADRTWRYQCEALQMFYLSHVLCQKVRSTMKSLCISQTYIATIEISCRRIIHCMGRIRTKRRYLPPIAWYLSRLVGRPLPVLIVSRLKQNVTKASLVVVALTGTCDVHFDRLVAKLSCKQIWNQAHLSWMYRQARHPTRSMQSLRAAILASEQKSNARRRMDKAVPPA